MALDMKSSALVAQLAERHLGKVEVPRFDPGRGLNKRLYNHRSGSYHKYEPCTRFAGMGGMVDPEDLKSFDASRASSSLAARTKCGRSSVW